MSMVSAAIGKRDEDDQVTVAWLTGTARRHAPRQAPTWEETAAAVAELRDIAHGRGDLLAEAAGLLIGFYAGTGEQMRAGTAARYCRAAGAAPEAIPRWIAEGQRRAAYARDVPYAS